MDTGNEKLMSQNTVENSLQSSFSFYILGS